MKIVKKNENERKSQRSERILISENFQSRKRTRKSEAKQGEGKENTIESAWLNIIFQENFLSATANKKKQEKKSINHNLGFLLIFVFFFLASKRIQ